MSYSFNSRAGSRSFFKNFEGKDPPTLHTARHQSSEPLKLFFNVDHVFDRIDRLFFDGKYDTHVVSKFLAADETIAVVEHDRICWGTKYQLPIRHVAVRLASLRIRMSKTPINKKQL